MASTPTRPETTAGVHDAGMAVRRAVLGDAHVDRAVAATTDFTADFQQMITEYAWGTIWTRPGLDRRSRSMITLTALVARGHHEELAMHVRAARRNGLTERRDQGTAHADRDLLRGARRQHGVPDRVGRARRALVRDLWSLRSAHRCSNSTNHSVKTGMGRSARSITTGMCRVVDVW